MASSSTEFLGGQAELLASRLRLRGASGLRPESPLALIQPASVEWTTGRGTNRVGWGERSHCSERHTGVKLLKVSRRAWAFLLAGASVAAPLAGCATPITAGVACGIGAHHPPGGDGMCVPNSISQSTRAKLLSAAQTAARENHGAVQRAVAVESTRMDASRYVTGATVTGNEVVWVVQVSGHFKCGNDCFSVSLASTGTVMTLNVDVKTFDVTGFGIGNKWVDLSHLGPVVVLRS